jgi:multimeric flavodoxin WrbA
MVIWSGFQKGDARMSARIIGISGSPVPNSNTDRLIKRILSESELSAEFIKLSSLKVGPCRACKRCASDNICKVDDDFPELAVKLLESEYVVIGGYTPYGMLDAFTKAFLERLWSMRHVKGLNTDRIVVTVISGMSRPLREAVLQSMAIELMMERTRHIAQLQIEGSVPCITCGYGDDCWGSGIPRYGPDARATTDLCSAVEEQPVWDEAGHVGKLIASHAADGATELPDIAEPLKELVEHLRDVSTRGR